MPKVSELIRKVKKAGCKFESQGTNHEWWYSPITDKKFQIPRHQSQEIDTRTYYSILKQAGIR